MKNMTDLSRYFYLSLILIITSCYPDKQPEEVPEEVSLEELRQETGGAPSEVTTQGNGIFFAYDQNCTAGFGWCDVNLAQPKPTTPGGEEPQRAQFKRYKATFYMGTQKDSNSLRIEFDEEIPHFASKFNIGYPDTLHSAFGYQYIIPKTGNYPTIQPSETLPNGAVEIPVTTGPRQQVYPEKQ